MDKMTELLLTVLALSDEEYKGPMSHAIPARLASALRKARKLEYVYIDDLGPYLEEGGSALLIEQGLGSPFCLPKKL